jgi:uncharacterized protein (DUF433 family)
MALVIHTDPPPLVENEEGVVLIAGTRIPLERVVRAFLAGSTPEQIAQDYDTVSIEAVYSVISYYLRHRAEVDHYLAEAQREATALRAESEQTWPPTDLRARLMAGRSAWTA